MKHILFLNSSGQQCGVYQYGRNFYQTIKDIPGYTVSYAECPDEATLHLLVKEKSPDFIIYNYFKPLMPFINKPLLNKIYGPIHICLAHELSDKEVSEIDGTFFHYYLFGHPTLNHTNPHLFTIKRIIPEYTNTYPKPTIPTFGSFGFGSKIKGYVALVNKVQKEFDEAIIRINIPSNSYFDPEATLAKKLSQKLQKKVYKKGISLQITHDFFSEKELLDFLAQNTANVFMYNPSPKMYGIASATDYALAVHRPVAFTKSLLFRHLFSALPSNVLEYPSFMGSLFSRSKNNSLREIITRDTSPPIFLEWNRENFKVDFIHIMNTLQSHISRSRRFNRILDDQARKEYQKDIDTLFAFAPKIMARKIPRANVQQAFVLDTVRCFAKPNAKILSVGSFEDTACDTLIKMGYNVDFIDPAINYDLNTFYKKATLKYDIIFSTSVIEHVEDDLLFVSQISQLLASEGIGVLTCDYKDGWKKGDHVFPGNFRFYTQSYIKESLLKACSDCELVDDPEWDCPHPDFEYSGQKYTFASIVFQKK